MPNRPHIIDQLIIKHLQQNLSVDEQAVLDKWLNEAAENKHLFEQLASQQYVSGEMEKLYAYDEGKGWDNLKDQFPLETEKKIKWFVWRRIAVAASVLLVVGLGSYFMFFNKKAELEEVVITAAPVDFAAPQANRAMITLANGQQVYLDSALNGKLLQQNGIEIVKLADGKIIYKGSATEMIYNTLSNPRGSKVIDMTLADGSHVWLNAGSSITYPVAFVGSERKVSITGEAYFEVAHNTAMPFKVNNGKMEVTVLGTHFNVNAYDDEADIKVTLLEGSVAVSNAGSEKTAIKPGEQAQVATNITVEKGIDVDEVMAWKNGRFQFGEKTDIGTIMRQISRWYNVDVEYKGTFTKHFGGSISSQVNVSQVLKVLETTGDVKCKIEGKKVTVMPR